MAYSHFLAASITMFIMASSTMAHSSLVNLGTTPTISSAPAVLPYPPPVSPYNELPPDISPLLPSPGGSAHSPAKSSMPTIPSSRSLNPDTTGSKVPGSAFAPSSPLQESSSVSQNIVKPFYSCLAVASFLVFLI
ncbi:hypothetical protein F511_33111 [Dorcoceras hygrometricum]|uniref:Classical arabinogalactan protein 26-like n=1 Tax=Dorcoceras hygrometricum TaxID=472368 RepID=A0A2Z7B3K1_9LAMI|nr:hypothetical protein F511_33111 [Dorcoceras hygrometricum]